MYKAIVLVSCVLAVWLNSCKTAPTACFTVLTPADSIKVGYTVRFDASCTSDATKYYWDFGNGQSASDVTTTQIVYTTAGTYQVGLTVGNDGKSASLAKMVVVNP